MGKKKEKHRKHGGGHEAHGGGHDRHGGGHEDHGGKHAGKGAFAGVAAMAMAQVKQQLDTPAGRQMLATGLRAAADALAPKRAPEPPAPPSASAAEAPSAFASNPAEPPRDPSPPRAEVPPEVARVIGSVAAGLEKWAGKFGAPRG